MFELETPTVAKLLDVVVLSQKNRQPDEAPGAKLSVEIALGNDSLAYFDGSLKSFLFTNNGSGAGSGQASLEGVAPVSDMPNLTKAGALVGKLHFPELELTGYSLEIVNTIGGGSVLGVDDCIVSNFRLLAKEGGTVIVWCDIESGDVPEKAFGKLATLKSREISLLLTPPEPGGQKDIEDDPKPREGGEVAWPFPKDGEPGGAPPRDHLVDETKKVERAAVKKWAAKKAPAKRAPMKYRNAATGETWSGRGLQPNWLKAALKAGRQLADFTVSPAH